MNKKIIACAIIAVLLLCACTGGNKEKAEGSSASTDNISEIQTNVSADGTLDKGNVSETEAETVTIPPIPESGIPEIPDAEVIYSDTEVVIVVDPEGTSYANGKPVPAETAASIIVQQMSPNKDNVTSTTQKKNPAVPDISDNNPEIEITLPNIIIPEETTRPQGTIIVDNVDKSEENDIFYLAKYVNTGKTDLAITDIMVFNVSKPGVTGIDAFKPGDTAIVNLWCNSEAIFDSVMYIVPEEAAHADSYLPEDCLLKYDMSNSLESGENQIAFEIEIPNKVIAGVYEFRFICGTEEGYIPFHIG